MTIRTKSQESRPLRKRELATHVRVKSNLLKRFNLILPVQSYPKIFSTLPVGQIIFRRPPRPTSQEGRLADRHERRGGMRWTRNCQLTSGSLADGEVVWS